MNETREMRKGNPTFVIIGEDLDDAGGGGAGRVANGRGNGLVVVVVVVRFVIELAARGVGVDFISCHDGACVCE